MNISIMTNEDKDALIVQLQERINLFELRIKDTVKAALRIVAEKEQRIAELEAQVTTELELLSYIAQTTSETAHMKYFELSSKYTAAVQRIAELEEQVPKVVTPVFNIGNFDCPECEYRTLPEPCLYCPGCGAKLDWRTP